MSKIIIPHGNRGQTFETLLQNINILYNNRKIASINKINTKLIPIRDNYTRQIISTSYEKSLCDYIGHYKGIPVAIEAKSTIGKRINYNAVKENQANFLTSWQSSSPLAESFIALSFNMDSFFIIPWFFWKNCLLNWKQKINKNQTLKYKGLEWQYNNKSSISEVEIPKNFKFPKSIYFQYIQFQLEAIKQNSYAIKHIKNPSEAVQLEAVKQDCWAIKNIVVFHLKIVNLRFKAQNS